MVASFLELLGGQGPEALCPACVSGGWTLKSDGGRAARYSGFSAGDFQVNTAPPIFGSRPQGPACWGWEQRLWWSAGAP